MTWPNDVVEQKSSIRKLHIDGLPFTTEGYERAKNILKSENKKQLGIANALISNIIWLPVTTTAQTRKTDEFYEKLLHNVQSLETLGRLRDGTENDWAVPDRLKGIKVRLAHRQVDWQAVLKESPESSELCIVYDA